MELPQSQGAPRKIRPGHHFAAPAQILYFDSGFANVFCCQAGYVWRVVSPDNFMRTTGFIPRALAALLVVIFGVLGSFAQTYDFSDSPTSTRKTRIYVPGGSEPVRGFLFNGNGAGGDASSEAGDLHKQAWADKHRFAIVATGFFGRFQEGLAGDDWRVFSAALQDAATRSGHPELVNAPFVAWGFSNGGQMTYGLARLLPDRAIAFITNKGGFYETGIGSDPVGVPAIWMAGQLDETNNRRATIEALYKAGRAAGAPWSWVEERNLGHSPGNSEALSFPFFDAVIAQRYPANPANVPTANAPPTLLPVDQSTGWLVDQEHAAWSTGYLEIRPASGYADDALQKGWVPDEPTARLYRSMASYDNAVPWDFAANARKAVRAVQPYNPNNPTTDASWQAVYHPDTAVYPPVYEVQISSTHTNWTSLEVYDGASLLTTITNNGSFTTPGADYHTVRVPLTMLDSSVRLNGIHAELVLPGGVRRTSHVTWLTSDADRVRPLAPPNLASNHVAAGNVTVATEHTFTWVAPANAPVAQYGIVVDSGTETYQTGLSLLLSDLVIGPHEIKVRAQGTNGVWGPTSTFSFQVIDPVSPPDFLTANPLSTTSLRLSWNDLAPAETAYEVERRSMDAASVVLLDEGDAGYTTTGLWTTSTQGSGFYGADFLHDGASPKGTASVGVAPSITGSYEVSAWVNPSQDADNRVPVLIEHAGGNASLTLNQSSVAPTNAWDFRDASNGVNIQHASVVNAGSQFDPAATISKWSYSAPVNASVTTGGNLRLRPAAGTGTSTFSGYTNTTTNLGYTSGTWALEVDLAGWNVVGTANDQWFQLGFMNDTGSTITCGLVLQQNASGLALWGRALGTGTPIGSVSAPIKQYPASQNSPVTLRLEADFTENTYRVFYRDSSTAGAFVEAATSGTIDPVRKGRALRLNMVQDWSQTDEFLDLTRIRTYQPGTDPGEGSWVSLGTYLLAPTSRVTLGSSGTIGQARADAFRFVPAGSGVWAPIASLPAGSVNYDDTGLTPGAAYEYRVRAVAAAVQGGWSPTASVTLPGGDPYAAWAATIDWGGLDSSPHTELPGNGLSNFLIFGLGGDPVGPGSKSHLLPAAVMTEQTDEIEFTFTRAQSTLTYIVESSQALAPDDWFEEFRNPGTPGGPVTVAVPLDGAPRKFVRLRITAE